VITMTQKLRPLLAILALGVAGCTTIPTGPSRMALPGTGKNFDQFQVDDSSCKQYALQASGATPSEAQENSAVKSAVLGTVLGAAAGAAIGGTSSGAGVGAGIGLLMGAASGAAAGDASGYNVQRRYDNGYSQCMYAKGHRVAVPGRMAAQRPAAQAQPAPQQPYYAPPPQAQTPYYGAPPPPGSAPPPPSAIVR
jgi:Glycine-zipper domain